MKKFFIALIIIGSIVNPVNVQAGEKVGTTSFQFLKLAFDARAAAMGNAFVSVANTSEAVFWNPAALRKVDGTDFALSYIDYFLDVNLFSLSASFPLNNISTIGLMAMAVDYGNFEVTDVTHQGWNDDYTHFNPGLTGEVINPGAYVFGISYAMTLTDKFSFGLSAKYAVENLIRAKASTIMFDGGLTYRTGWKSIELGISVKNFGPEVKFLNEYYPLPETFAFGISGYLFSPEESVFFRSDSHSLLFAYNIIHPRDYDQQHNIGLEYSYNKLFFIRGGYKMNYDEEGVTFGAGIKYNNLRIDYAYDPYGDILPTVHRFSIGYELH